jgi:O-succinylbenzoate synthase
MAQEFSTPICIDETLRDARAAGQIAELGGPKVWNVKVHRVGGLSEVTRIVAIAHRYGAKLWAGTMPESGIGSQAALAAGALPGFIYPSDLEPSARWFGPDGDVVRLTMSSDGRMEVPWASVDQLLDHDRFRASSTMIRSWNRC